MNKFHSFLTRVVTAVMLTLLSFSFLGPIPVHAIVNIHYAAPSAIGNADCSGWVNACSLETALGNASNGDQVWVKAGIHHPGFIITDTFILKNGVAVYGGFIGDETTITQRNWQNNVTTLNGNGNNYHVVTASGTNNTAILDGFFITSGNANGAGSNSFGGGIYSDNGSPTLTNITFSGNFASMGGGMYNSNNSNPILVNVTFSGNTAGTDGAGMHNSNSNPSLNNVTFIQNAAGDYGGGMHNDNSNPTLNNVTFDDNSAINGGGISNIASSTPTITNATFKYNLANEYGGGVFNNNSNPTLINAYFFNNNANKAGGGIYNASSSPILTNIVLYSNTATEAGGGVRNFENSNPTLKNVTLYANDSVEGGGIGNRSNSNPTLVNSILWGNTATSGPQIHNAESSAATVTYSLVQAGWSGTGNLNTDPLFVNLPGGSLRLSAGSPAIDSGSNASCAATDRDGKSRPKDGNGDGSLICDMGAYEFFVTFADVSSSLGSWDYIERLYAAGITGGCATSPLRYCPNNSVTRSQMAVFLLRSRYGSSYTPPAVGASTGFADVPITHQFAAWIKQLAAEGVTTGCGGGNYCPDAPVTRAQMSIFLLRAKHGSSYIPPAATGLMFADVPITHPQVAWIEQLANEGVTGGCGGGNYCPGNPVTRAQMAIFLVRAFSLP